MRFMYCGKDGGKDSTVWGFWPIELKKLFSVALLKFDGKSREAYHDHAFDSVSWVLKGALIENQLEETCAGPQPCLFSQLHFPSLKPIFTSKYTYHKVDSKGVTWVLTFRGPWTQTWHEYLPLEDRFKTLTHGRKEV